MTADARRSAALDAAVRSQGPEVLKMLVWWIDEGPISMIGKKRTLAAYPGTLSDIRKAFRLEMSRQQAMT